MRNKELVLPMKLQMFAGEPGEPQPESGKPGESQPESGKGEPAPDEPEGDKGEGGAKTDELMAELAKMRVEQKKTQDALDRALKEKADAVKALRAKQTVEEIEDEAKREEEERHLAYVAELEEYKKKNEAMKRYMEVQKMPTDLAEKAAEAEVSGDMDALSEIQRQHSEATLKAARADWQKSIPQPQFGTGDYSSMTKEEIMAIKDTDERVRAIARNKHLFK